MIYEVRLTLLPDEGGEAADYRAYLDRAVGAGQWLALPEAAPGVVRLLCRGEALARLKWADIHDGVVRVRGDRRLSGRERARHRSGHGRPFPWEGG